MDKREELPVHYPYIEVLILMLSPNQAHSPYLSGEKKGKFLLLLIKLRNKWLKYKLRLWFYTYVVIALISLNENRVRISVNPRKIKVLLFLKWRDTTFRLKKQGYLVSLFFCGWIVVHIRSALLHSWIYNHTCKWGRNL